MTKDFKNKELIGEIQLSLAGTLRVTKVTHDDDTEWVDVRTFVPIQLGDELMPTKKGIHIAKKFVPQLIALLEGLK